uniref:UL46 protein n=1 Tax=Anatid alphaherpesvirus 2 TaxID=3080522 RepID=A0AAU0K798_9ALPH
MIPTMTTVSMSALRALEERAEPFLPPMLIGARRDEALSRTPGNGVPEGLIIESVLSDSNGLYLASYRTSARRSLKEAGVTSDAAWSAFLDAYWKYLSVSSGLGIVVEHSASSAKHAEGKKSTTALLLRSAFSDKPLSKHPFKESSSNTAYGRNMKDVRRAMDAVQKYLYYSRPSDPMNHSPDTAVRLNELLSYASTLYRWLLWFMDMLDARVLKDMGFIPSPYGPREPKTPDQLFEKHMRGGPGPMAGDGCAVALVNLTHDALMALLRVSMLWTMSVWKRKHSGVAAAVVSAVELATLVHHHCQYIINMMMVGYVCWLEGGADDPNLMAALRNQGRYCHFLGKLAPTATSHSWASMEVGTMEWFNVAIARSVMSHGGPTPHYILTMDSDAAAAIPDRGCLMATAARHVAEEERETARQQQQERSKRMSCRRRSRTKRVLIPAKGGGSPKPISMFDDTRDGQAAKRDSAALSIKRCGGMQDLSAAGGTIAATQSVGYWYDKSPAQADDEDDDSYTDGDSGTPEYVRDALSGSSYDDSPPEGDSVIENVYVSMEEIESRRLIEAEGGNETAVGRHKSEVVRRRAGGAATYSVRRSGDRRVSAHERLGPLPPVPDDPPYAVPRRKTFAPPRNDSYDTPRGLHIPKYKSFRTDSGSVVNYDVPRPVSISVGHTGIYDTPRGECLPEDYHTHADLAHGYDDEADEASPSPNLSRNRPKSCLVRGSRRRSSNADKRTAKLERAMQRLGICADNVDGLLASTLK